MGNRFAEYCNGGSPGPLASPSRGNRFSAHLLGASLHDAERNQAAAAALTAKANLLTARADVVVAKSSAYAASVNARLETDRIKGIDPDAIRRRERTDKFKGAVRSLFSRHKEAPPGAEAGAEKLPDSSGPITVDQGPRQHTPTGETAEHPQKLVDFHGVSVVDDSEEIMRSTRENNKPVVGDSSLFEGPKKSGIKNRVLGRLAKVFGPGSLFEYWHNPEGE